MNHAVYMDHNATSPVRAQAAVAAREALDLVGNASSVHRFGCLARRTVEEAREQVAALAGVEPEGVVFTSGGTEANHLALKGLRASRVLASAVEHPSVLKARDDIEIIPVDGEGIVDLKALDSMLAEGNGPTVVALMLANNETGTIEPVARAAEIARRHGALVHCDAVQALGKVPVDVTALGAHTVSASAHKLGGLPGVGALILAQPVDLIPQLRGGGQEQGLRAGTENVPGIAAFGVAVAAAASEFGHAAGLAKLRDRLETTVRRAAPEVRIIGAGAERLPNTSLMVIPGRKGATQVMALDLAGVAVSAGSACSSGTPRPSHVLRAMGYDDDLAEGAIRISLGWSSRMEDIDRFLDAWAEIRSGDVEGGFEVQPAA